MATLKNIMRRNVKTVKESATISEVSRLLIKNKLSGVPVIDKNKNLKGFVSEKDIVGAIASEKFHNKKVKDIMTEKVIFLEDYTTLDVVSQVFTRHPIKHLPVTRKKRLVGIVSRKDVINNLVGQYY
ncbi:MAG: CBS domain-containing protein [Candidatus Omnitrophica bacterium]|nr:CBS domain-containing protein [Candidatus Omnitrophota bacterium]